MANSEITNLNINLSESRKKRYTIDGDENRILEFDPYDLGILSRLEEVETAIIEAVDKFGDVQDTLDFEDPEVYKELAKQLRELDTFIRQQLDYLFDTNFSEVCAPHGTMLDPINGEMRFTYLVDIFTDIFTDNISKALEQRNKKIKQHTKKYVEKVK